MYKALTDKILINYPIQERIHIEKFKHGIGGTSFLLKTRSKNYVLKIYTAKNAIEKLQHILKFMIFLHQNNFPTNKIVKNLSNGYISKIDNKAMVLMEFVNGNTIPWKKISKTTAKDIAKLTYQLYEIGLAYHKKNEDFQNDALLNLEKIKKEYAKKNHLKFLHEANLFNIRKSIIHSDISRENLLTNMHHRLTAIIDFDDTQENYLVWDYATLITQVFITKTYGIDWEALRNFHLEFSKNFKWNKDELRMIIPLMLHRNEMVHEEVSKKSSSSEKKLSSIAKSVEYKIKLIEDNVISLIEIFKSST